MAATLRRYKSQWTQAHQRAGRREHQTQKDVCHLSLELDTTWYLLEKSCKALPKKQLTTVLQTEWPKDISRACPALVGACWLLHVSRSSLHYQSTKYNTAVQKQLESSAVSHPTEGFWKCYHWLRNSGEVINHKQLHCIYKHIRQPLRRKVKKRLPARVKEPLAQPAHFTHTWSVDFMSDALSNGVKFRSFLVIDDYNRKVLYLETDYSSKSSRVVWVLQHLAGRYGKPQKIRMDNGSEFVARLVRK